MVVYPSLYIIFLEVASEAKEAHDAWVRRSRRPQPAQKMRAAKIGPRAAVQHRLSSQAAAALQNDADLEDD